MKTKEENHPQKEEKVLSYESYLAYLNLKKRQLDLNDV
jgi:hypothetical protein